MAEPDNIQEMDYDCHECGSMLTFSGVCMNRSCPTHDEREKEIAALSAASLVSPPRPLSIPRSPEVSELIERTRPVGKCHPIEILDEWLKGCSCVDPFPGGHPVTCEVCTREMIKALRRSIVSLSYKALP